MKGLQKTPKSVRKQLGKLARKRRAHRKNKVRQFDPRPYRYPEMADPATWLPGVTNPGLAMLAGMALGFLFAELIHPDKAAKSEKKKSRGRVIPMPTKEAKCAD
jgi:hypothetical protein